MRVDEKQLSGALLINLHLQEVFKDILNSQSPGLIRKGLNSDSRKLLDPLYYVKSLNFTNILLVN